MAKNTFPDDWRDQPCFLVAVPRPLVPYVGGLLKILENRGFWLTQADFVNGYTASIEFQECLMATCLSDLIEGIDRVSRRLDTYIAGKVYTVESTDPLVVTPSTPPVVALDILDQDSLLGRIDRLTQLTDNAINGTDTPLYTDTNSVKALIQGVIDALSADNTDLDGILSQLETIAILVA